MRSEKFAEIPPNYKIYDAIIVGGGTAGLTAAIEAAKKKWDVIVLEKGSKTGPLPRGESMAYFTLEDEILGKDFIESITSVGPSHRRYHSPWDKKQTLVNVHTSYRFFPWRPFISRFEQKAQEFGAKIKLNTEVIALIKNSQGICIGVKYRDNQGVHAIYGYVTLAADGHNSILGREYGIDYSRINCPIIKFLGDNANVNINKTPNPQFFLLSPGQLKDYPHFPPAAAYYFPIGDRKIEAGLMLRMGQIDKLKDIKYPSDDEIEAVWNHLKQKYPGFSEVFKGINIEYEALTQMPNARMVKNFILGRGGAILIGDSAGFVDANGSSGLHYGMQMASDWVSILDPIVKAVKQRKQPFETQISTFWSLSYVEKFEKQFRKTDVYKHIKRSYSMIAFSEWLIFRLFKKPTTFNKMWWLFAFMIKTAS